MQAELIEIINLSLKKALDHDARGNIGQAYAYYNAVLELCPSKRAELEKKFESVLCEWGLYLEQNNRLKDVVKCYQNSIGIFPKNSTILNNFAAHLLRNEEYLEAVHYLQRALESDPNFLPAERNVQNAYSMAVDRWHFSMLNDQSRNQAFEQAIKKRILLGYDTVLDIGTGTGILSLYACDGGAKKVYACEYSPVMCDIAKKVFLANQAENVKLICKSSSDLKVPKDIDERVKLIVTEIFDAALFGESVIPTLIYAHENLLSTDGTGIIIPMSATLYIAAVECEYIRLQSSVNLNECQIGSLIFENIVVLTDEEYYDTENLRNVDLNYITEPKSLIKINFNDLVELKNFMKNGIKERLCIVSSKNGIVDSLVAWFKLNLDESIILDSSDKKSCWQSAVFPTYPIYVKSNDKIVINAQIFNGRLKCSYQLDCDIEKRGQLVYKLPKDIITFLNDKEYIEFLIEGAKSKKHETIKTVFDTSPFPVYGLTILKEHSNCETLYFQTENPALMHFIEYVMNTNSINGKVIFVTNFDQIACTLDNIYVHNFDTKGELVDWGQQSYQEIHSCLLSSSGTLLPKKILLMAQLIYSEELPKMVSVKDENVQKYQVLNYVENSSELETNDSKDNNCRDKFNSVIKEKTFKKSKIKLKIAEYINRFKINQVFDLNSSLYNYTAMSEPKILAEINESEFNEEVIVFNKINAKSNQNIPNALLCWYKIFITDNLVIETKRNNSFMNHSAIVLENELKNKVLAGEDVYIKVKQMCNLVRVSVE